jgi:hypothetical protein
MSAYKQPKINAPFNRGVSPEARLMASQEVIRFDFNDEQCEEPTFVIHLLDLAGREYYLTETGTLATLSDLRNSSPLVIPLSQLSAHLEKLRGQHPANCQVYAVHLHEFGQKRIAMN